MYVSQQMGSMYSPSDPIFWSHHANMDRLFAIWQDCFDYEQYCTAPTGGLSATLYTAYGPNCGYSYALTAQMPFTFQYQASIAFPASENPTAQQAFFLGGNGCPGWQGTCLRYGPDYIANEFITGQAGKNPLCPSNANGWQVVNQPLAGASASAVGKRSLTDSEADLFNETVAFLEAQISTAQSAGLEGQDALEFIATAECQNSPPLEITPVLEAWIKMNQGNISSYDRICDNSSARFCAAFPDSELCLEEEWEEEAEALIIVDRTLEVVAIAEGVIIVILLIFSIVSCIKQQGVVRVDDSYVTMGAQKF